MTDWRMTRQQRQMQWWQWEKTRWKRWSWWWWRWCEKTVAAGEGNYEMDFLFDVEDYFIYFGLFKEKGNTCGSIWDSWLIVQWCLGESYGEFCGLTSPKSNSLRTHSNHNQNAIFWYPPNFESNIVWRCIFVCCLGVFRYISPKCPFKVFGSMVIVMENYFEDASPESPLNHNKA